MPSRLTPRRRRTATKDTAVAPVKASPELPPRPLGPGVHPLDEITPAVEQELRELGYLP